MTERSLDILIPNYPAADSFTENVVYTLRAMGHNVRCMESLAFRDQGRIKRIVHDVYTGFYPQVWSAQEKWAIAETRKKAPDLVLCLTLSLREEVLSELRAAGASQLAAWWGDTPANMRGMGLLADGWDQIYIKDAAAVAKFKAVGLPASLMHEAANPAWHKPIKTENHEDANAVVVAGNYYGYRQILVSRLAECGTELALYGSKPPRWANDVVQAGFRNRYIVKEEKSRVFHGGLACLNSTHLSEGNSLNCRAFEVCGAGGLQLIEDKPAISDCYEPGQDVLVYRSVEDIVEYLERARKDRAWALSLRESGHARTLSEHTYRHRLERILYETGLASHTHLLKA